MVSSKTVAIGLVSFGLAATMSTVNAQDSIRVVDVQLRASSSATPPSGPDGYKQIGYWDVDGGGSKGTDGSTGHWMMALYAKRKPVGLMKKTQCVTDIQLRASSSSTPPSGPNGYKLLGYWDVDGGGANGTDGSTGHWMMAMYANKGRIASGADLIQCVADVQLTASNTATATPGPSGYKNIGDWDVDAGGSKGTDGSTGHWKMAMYTKTAAVCVEKETLVDNNMMTMCPVGSVVVGIAGGYGHSSAYNKPHRIRCCPLR